MSLYVGVNGSTKKVSKLLVGVNGAAKEVSTGYTGVNSGLNKVYSNFDIDKELQVVNPVAALTSGKITTADIGKTVYLSNSATTCQEWQIAGVNHDGTSGTVDLFSKHTFGTKNDTVFDGSSNKYHTSSLRTYLNSTVLNGFTAEIQNAMKVQDFPSNGTTLSDKVKCPSIDELGYKKSYNDHIGEGTIYPIFGVQLQYPNTLATRNTPDEYQTSVQYWTRSHSAGSGIYVWCAGSADGRLYIGRYDDALFAVACIRF